MLGIFFFPGGYDFLFKITLDYTHSYLITDLVFYGISFLFLITYLLITKTKVKSEVNERVSKAEIELIKIKSKIY